MTTEKVLAAREEIDAKLQELESFSFDVVGDDEIKILATLIHAFHTGSETKARHATLVQIERAKKAIPRILGELVPQVLKRHSESECARSLVDPVLGKFLSGVAKLYRSRTEQSRSGKGDYGRDTIAKLKEELAQRNAELAVLRQAKETECEEDEEEPAEEPQPEEEAA